MNTMSASHAEARPARTLVWDAPVRVFHWLMVASFFVAYFTAESERWQLVHVTAGYTMIGLVAFRIVWGLVGTQHARFSDFVRGPSAVVRYLRSLVGRRPEHHAGHNPAGGLAVLALLGLTLATTVAGWATYNELGGEWLEEAHELFANLMMLVVIVHVIAVVASSLLHHENLVAAMISGRKPVPPQEGIRRAWRGLAVVMLVAVLSFWWLQWQSAPQGGMLGGSPAAQSRDQGEDD